jgi:hypothetical protein
LKACWKKQEFKKTASQLDIETENLASRDTQDSSKLKIKITNNGLKRINRILNPVNYTLKGKYDQDYYGAEYVKPIPNLQPMEELANIIPNTTQQKALFIKLMRAKNQVKDAVEDAAWITQYTLKKLRK